MIRRRRMIGRGFEGLELPPAPGLRRVPAFEDFQISQAGRLPRRAVLEPVASPAPGPEVVGSGFDRGLRPLGMLDQPGTMNIGRTVVIQAFGSNQSVSILEARASDQRARQLTVFLHVLSNTATLVRDLTAIVSWGTGGGQIDTEIDFVNGTAFSVVASYLRIIVRNDAPPPGVTNFQVGAFIGYDARPSGSAVRGPQRTAKTGAIVVAATADVPIPRFATSFSYIRNPLTTAITFSLLDAAGNVLGLIPLAAGVDASDRVFPIPNDASAVRVTAAAVDQIRGRMIFGLAL